MNNCLLDRKSDKFTTIPIPIRFQKKHRIFPIPIPINCPITIANAWQSTCLSYYGKYIGASK